jgi:hypothetical protein
MGSNKQPLPARRGDFLDRQLIFLKAALHKEPSPEPQAEAPTASSPAAVVARAPGADPGKTTPQRRSAQLNSHTDAALFDDLGAVWQEPSETVQRPRTGTQVFSSASPTKQGDRSAPLSVPLVEPAAEKPHADAPPRPLSRLRHPPLSYTRANKPDSPPPDARVIGYLVAGGSRVLRPLKREARVQRNRLIFVSIVCLILLFIVWKIVGG